MPDASFADTVTDWEQLLAKVTANAADLGFLDESHAGLTGALQRAKEASGRQATFKSQFQQATRDLEESLKLGRDLATRLRNGVRTRYGLTGEKLAEFKLRPRRAAQKGKTKKKHPGPVLAPVHTEVATPPEE
jgi:hypothetical protein